MRLDRLRLYDFRNYASAAVHLHPGVNLIVGENAQGKTNLLESVFYLSTGRSFRTARRCRNFRTASSPRKSRTVSPAVHRRRAKARIKCNK